jgi:transposase
MRKKAVPQQLDYRRLQAINRLEEGESYRTVADELGVSLNSIVLWARAYREQGWDGLLPRPIPGRAPGLSHAPKAKLEQILLRGALKAGYATDLWTLKRVAEVIEKHFHIRYHPCHVWKILRAMAWSCQKPERRALQRKEQEIQHWKRSKWPRIKKSLRTWRPSGFPR